MANELVQIPIAEKAVLSLNEAAAYSNIGIHKLQQICNTDAGKKFAFKNGNRNMIKRKAFDAWLEKVEQI